jgi:DNA-binding transcriptional MerR regulator
MVNQVKSWNNLMRIGELAKRAGTTLRTIRYYEEQGLIAYAARTQGGFRLYAEAELRKLHLIRRLQLLDVPLARVKAFFDARRSGSAASEIAPGMQRLRRWRFWRPVAPVSPVGPALAAAAAQPILRYETRFDHNPIGSAGGILT